MGSEGHAVRGGRVRRSVRPATLAGRAAVRWAGTYLAFGDARRRKREQFVLRTAEDVTRTMGDMKGAVMKVGQVLSMMTGVLPDEMAGQLSALQSNAPPMAFGLVEQVFHTEFGLPPNKIFRRFDHEPFAAASIGQVHRAVLDDGRKVAVKVQYPGVADAIEHDLANVGLMLSMAGLVARGLDVSTIVADLKEGIRAELDYLREAEHQQRFAALFEGHGFVLVPKVYRELTTRHVIVQQFIEGRPFREAFALPQHERNRLAEIVYRFCFGGIYRHGLFNGDPHPGNYILTPDGGVAFVDYGCVTEFPPATVAAFGRILNALLDRDIEAWRAATEAIGILHPNAPFTTAELYEHMHWYWAPVLEERVTFTPELAAEMVRRNTQTNGQGGAINRHCNVPEGMVFLTRINFGLAGLMASLRAEGPWRGIIAEYVRGLPPTTDLGRLSAATTSAGEPI